MLVPQSLSYAKLATLPVQYGLYSSFVGVVTYCFFATSKDVTIGPVAVMSLQTATVIASVQSSIGNEFTAPEIATTLAFFCGIITLGMGLLRLDFLVEFIPYTAIAGFMTGSAITISLSQIPSLLGNSAYLNTHAAGYLVIINTLKYLPKSTVDAAIGFPCLFFLYAYRYFFKWVARRYPKHKRFCFFALVLRNAIVILFVTIFSYVACRHRPKNPPISIVKTVPSGFQNVGLFHINKKLVSAMATQLPVSTVVLLLEHIAISRSFGRVNDYKIRPSQELIAIGVTNTLGTFFNSYPATGSFSRTAISSMSGVRTPLAGIVTGLVVILALYALTGAFYYIPTSGLAASLFQFTSNANMLVIIHAVGDLIVPPKQAYRFWRINPLEFFIFIASVIVAVFTTLEGGIYTAVGASLVILLFRIARPGGAFLGRVRISAYEGEALNRTVHNTRSVYVPLTLKNLNPGIKVEDAPPGIVIFRFEDSFVFPNASLLNDRIVTYVKQKTRRGQSNLYQTLGQRPWNEGFVPRSMTKYKQTGENDNRPLLRAIVYDFGAVAHVDSTTIQALIDTRQQLERYADRQVEFHFAQILSPWVRRALVSGGFGTGNPQHRIVEVASVAPVAEAEDPSTRGEEEFQRRRLKGMKDLEEAKVDVEETSVGADYAHSGASESEVVALHPTNYPFFHLDVDGAVRAAERIPLH